jgi:DNA-binding transcriptional LysR family regulator
MSVDLRLLRHARALAEEGSFARAARSLHLTQPALSRSIQILEQRVGVPLFDRGRTRVAPTDLGRVFLEHARQVLDGADALEREVALMRGASGGRLSLGAGTLVASMFVDDALARFAARNAQVGIRVVNDSGSELLGRLRLAKIDLFVGSVPTGPERAGLTVVPLATRTGRFMVRAGHPLAGRTGLSIAEVMSHPLVCTSRLTPGITEVLIRARGSDDPRPLPDFACESPRMMRAVTLGSDHVMLGALAMFADDVAAGRLVPLRVDGAPPTQAFGIVRLEARTLPAVAAALIEAIVEADRESADAERALEAVVLGPVAPCGATRAGGPSP